MNFSRFLDLQSWWEVPSIAYFCSLFRTAFNLLDFDIEELEEALLTDGTEESASSLLTELIVRLLNGCLGNNDISAFNYQMYLRRLFRRKCQETGRYNPFNTDIDFQFLPLRTKVEILYALCDFRLDAEDVFDLFKNLEAESLRVEPLGWDDNDSAYWYFYGTRLYREDIIKKPKGKSKKKKNKESRKRGWFYGDDWLDDEESERVWQVVCFTEEDWTHLTEKFKKATSKVEKELYRSLSQNFLPEIPRLFQEKERLQRKRLLELAPRRTSSRVLQKIKQKAEESKQSTHDDKEEEEERKKTPDNSRESRAKRRNLLRSKSPSSDSSDSSESEREEMPQKVTKQAKGQDKRSKNSSATQKGEPPPEPPVKTGRKTNNSLASATGQIVIPDNDEPVSSTRKKLKTSQIFSQTEEDIQTDMYKVLEQLTAHEDAWPFMDPVEEEYAPNYYAVIRRPMDLRKMEQRLDTGYYTDFSMFKADFKLIVNNCRLYNGQDNEYTLMVDNLQAAFDRLTEKYMHRLSSSDEEIAVEYQLPTPSRKHKLKASESPSRHKKKKRKSHSDTGEAKSSSDVKEEEETPEPEEENQEEVEHKKSKESHKSKDGKGKKKRKGHHRHGKHSKNHRSHKGEHGESAKRHSRKHSKNKDKDGKKSKQKKKKSKHHEVEPVVEEIKRAPSQESLESSNRSRSASPLPSIHTPSPSPTELNERENSPKPEESDLFSDKYDKIKLRRRHAAKDAWDSLFDYKQKTAGDKQNLQVPEKEKNQKLRETIEKLKAKNEKYKETSLFNSLFTPNHSGAERTSETSTSKETSNKDADEDVDSDGDLSDIPIQKIKTNAKKGNKKTTAKNESASEALEQAVKDISKWLDDAPKSSAVSSPCDSPAQTISTEEHDNSRLDDEFSIGEKSTLVRKDTGRKRPSSREPKLLKRREIQRTIDRLQPGKGKGNLLTNMSNKNSEKVEDATPLGPVHKLKDSSKAEESSPKLSLGSVLPTVEFTLGTDHNFTNDEVNSDTQIDTGTIKKVEPKTEIKKNDKVLEKKEDPIVVQPDKKDAEVETDLPTTIKPSQEKATPNLSAWFKAFGAPKNTNSTTVTKKKHDDHDFEEKASENTNNEVKSTSPKNMTVKYDSPTDPDTPNPDGGDSPLPNVSATPRQRRTSTGSSVSERSSFSQDLDSPRHQMSHTSPLLRSPASPRTDDFQKITYPIINGTIRAGFYQDTTSIKSSPEKSCSPREAPQSPYSPYSSHVYASNNVMGSATPNYFVDHNKSPLPSYSQNPPPYYDTSKVPMVNKPVRVHDDYTSLGPDSYPQNQYTGPFSPAHPPYPQNQPNHAQPQNSPQPIPPSQTSQPSTAQILPDPKNSLFPVKKRAYNEPDLTMTAATKIAEAKDLPAPAQNKTDYQKIGPSLHSMSSLPTPSVDDIALALSEKSEMAKINSLREKSAVNYTERHGVENRDVSYNAEPIHHENKKDLPSMEVNKPIAITNKKDGIDMVNMGYMNSDHDRRNVAETHEVDFSMNRELSKGAHAPQQKGYEVEAIAINLGLNSQQHPKLNSKPNITNIHSNNIPPAHSQAHNEMLNQTVAHAHHNQYDVISGQSIGNFSLNDIELANKKLYACNATPSPAALDYGNWKMSNQMRKQDLLPSDYATNYSTNNSDKLKQDTGNSNTNAINYNKNVQQPYNNYGVPRTTMQRTQDLQQSLPSELRIPNPRGHLKNDHGTNDNEMVPKANDLVKTQKAEKLVQNHPLVGSLPYKTPYSTHSALPLESLRNLPKIPQMLDRYTNEERYLSSFAGSTSALYHDKTFQMAQMFNKSISSDVHPTTSVNIYSQPAISISKDNSIYKSSGTVTSQPETKSKAKRKRTSETKAHISSQSYHPSPCSTDVLSSVKSSILPGSAFNFGSTANMALGGGLYGDNTGFSIEDFRNSTANQLMAANYMAAAVAHQQRNNAESSADKLVKPAHQNSTHAAGTFPFIGHSQVRAGYPFVGAEPSSPLYQQYLQRHQEELLRQTGAQIMGLYPPGYPAGLGVRQPYDSINRPSWL
ncbi:bromodomain-containing protein DDB_G0270170-like [Ostrinia furnacalis]|uniref:bromodomain-containing protein DDB_G0270170-like n=1 Tax=Ostrinia furnacalis TaxID=93504 RepID=UPI00103FBD80|nr:bromodomain-containing protein DDB_G0270170-like [Ostrinia furnacalis]XP_028174186.1 bromodomain-containing protein DDB_G0270170-like [Ostrinia furnacalis]XP_028174187.1 bromodomain-containing protein DDB_G0270170-like [Ostrinia furnacalis]XP_028174188.1 bromodomain-containing protein DDB_G0270170-like [Ostrinia furnacalis]